MYIHMDIYEYMYTYTRIVVLIYMFIHKYIFQTFPDTLIPLYSKYSNEDGNINICVCKCLYILTRPIMSKGYIYVCHIYLST
jgi:hypothetical protein